MPFRTEYQFLFVGRDEGSFLENYSYDLTEEHGEKGGQIFITLEVQNNPGEAEMIGEALFDALRKEFFSDLEKDPYGRFEDAVKSVNHVLEELKAGKTSHYIGNLHCILAGIVGDSLFLTQTGEAEAYLIRRRFVSSISEGLSEGETGDMFNQIASGSFEPDDKVIFSSTRLLRYISKTDFAKIVSQGDLVQGLNDIKDVLSSEVLGRISIIGLKITEVAVGDESPARESRPVSVRSRESFISMPGLMSNAKGVVVKVSSFFARFRREERPAGIEETKIDRAALLRRFTHGGWTKDKIFASFVVVILLLTLGIYVVRTNQGQSAEILALDNSLNIAREQVSSAETKGQYDKNSAGELLLDAESKAMNVLQSGFHRGKATELMTQIQQTRDTLDNVKRVASPRMLVDLAEKKASANPLGLLSMKGRFFSFDPLTLFEIVVDKVEQPLALDPSELAIAGTSFDDQSTLLFLTKSGRVMRVKDADVSFATTDEGAFHKGVALDDYSNKVYILDPESNKIWKYTYAGTRDKFGKADPYNVSGDVTEGVDLAIDSSVFVLNKDGSITRFYAGAKKDFLINKAPFTGPKSPTKIYTETDMSQVFVMDPSQNRIFVYMKDPSSDNLNYAHQLVFDDVTDLRDMLYDKDSGKLYVLAGTKMYEVTL